MNYETLQVERRDRIAFVAINRPDKRNAVTTGMWLRIAELMLELAATPGVRLIVIRGAGGVYYAHYSYLEMPSPLRPGCTYTIALADSEPEYRALQPFGQVPWPAVHFTYSSFG